MTEIVKESTGMNPKIKERIEQIYQGIVPEGYKKTRIGIIPEEWECKRLAKILKVKHGKSQKGIENNHGKYPILATSGVIGKTDQYLYNKESVLIGRKGTINRPYYMNSPFWTIDTLFYTEINESHCAKFIYYKFCNINWLKYNEASGVPSLSSGTIESIFVSLPRKKEQQQIADILSTWDRAIELKEALIREKEEQKKGLMQRLLKPKQTWEEVKLGDLSTIVTGATPSTSVLEYYNGKYPWITPTDIKDEKYIYTSERTLTEKGIEKGRFVPKGSLLVTCIASIGKNAILEKDGSCNQQINAIYPSEDHSNEFLYYLISYNTNKLLSYAATTATSIISKKTFENIRFLIPDLEEQENIANVLSIADQEISLLKQELSLLKEQKKGLMQLLLTGIVRVGEVEDLE